MVRAIVGDLPIYPRLRDELEIILASLDFTELLERDLAAADIALWVAATQSVHSFSEETRSRNDEWLTKAGEVLKSKYEKAFREANEEEMDNVEVESKRLIDTAIYFSVRPEGAAESINYFAGLLRRMTFVWLEVSQHLDSLVTKLLFELPAAHLGELWMGALALRASRRLP